MAGDGDPGINRPTGATAPKGNCRNFRSTEQTKDAKDDSNARKSPYVHRAFAFGANFSGRLITLAWRKRGAREVPFTIVRYAREDHLLSTGNEITTDWTGTLCDHNVKDQAGLRSIGRLGRNGRNKTNSVILPTIARWPPNMSC